MTKQEIKTIVLYLIFAVILALVILELNEKKVPERVESSIPPKPLDEPMYYDFSKHTWVKIYRSRANVSKESSKGFDIERHLQNKIPGYLENTYWGEDWGYEDTDDDWDWEDEEQHY